MRRRWRGRRLFQQARQVLTRLRSRVWLAVVLLVGLTATYATQTNTSSQAVTATFDVDVLDHQSGTIDTALLTLDDLDLGDTDEVNVWLSAYVSCAAGVSTTSIVLDFPAGFTVEGDDGERKPPAVEDAPCVNGTAQALIRGKADADQVFESLEPGQWYFVVQLFDGTNAHFEDRGENLTIDMTFADAGDMHAQDLFDAPKYPRAHYLEWSDYGLVESSGTLVSPEAAHTGHLWEQLLLLLIGAIGGFLVTEFLGSVARHRGSNTAAHERRMPHPTGNWAHDDSDSQGIA